MKPLFLSLIMTLTTTTSFASNSYKLNCNGTEPFWSINVKPNYVTVDLEFTGKSATNYFGVTTQELPRAKKGTEFTISASKNRGARRVTLYVRNAGLNDCNDGMSPKKYNYFVNADVEGISLSGCCSIAR